MKRFISLLLVAIMALSLIACGTTEAPAATEAAPSADVAMQYIKADEAKNLLDNGEYVFFDGASERLPPPRRPFGSQVWPCLLPASNQQSFPSLLKGRLSI